MANKELSAFKSGLNAKKSSRRRSKKTMSIVELGGVALGGLETITAGGTGTVSDFLYGGSENMARQLIAGTTGYDIETQGWALSNAARFWVPTLAGKAVKMGLNWLGIRGRITRKVGI